MGVYSEIRIDSDRCDDCGHLLYEHIASVRSHETLAEYDGELHVALVKLVECSGCGYVTRIHYMGEPVSVRLEALASNFIAAVPTG